MVPVSDDMITNYNMFPVLGVAPNSSQKPSKCYGFCPQQAPAFSFGLI